MEVQWRVELGWHRRHHQRRHSSSRCCYRERLGQCWFGQQTLRPGCCRRGSVIAAGSLLFGWLAPAADAHGLDVLVFTKTAGFAHPSIPAGVTALQQLGAEHDFGVTVTNDAATMIAALPTHQVVVFLNTTGDVLDTAQETSFKAWYQAGGGFLGIHAAADTEHGWPWYLDLVGAEFKDHPAIQQAQVKFLDRRHPITDVIDPATSAKVERWTYTDEWYNF